MNPDKLKILICILYYFPHRTGMQLYIQRIAEELIQRGHEVTVLVARHKADLPAEEIINGVRVVRLRVLPVAISRGMLMPAYPWAAYQLMRQHDVVSIHTPMSETALLSILSTLTGRTVIPSHHGDLLLPPGLSNRIIQNVTFALYQFMANRAPKVIAYTEDYADHSYYLKPFREKVQVIYPPITMPDPNPQRAKALRAEWSHNGGPVIGFAGRFVQEKRPDLLIQSLDVVTKKYPDARIVFAGQHIIPYENTWELYKPIVDKYHKHLIFLGLVSDMQFMADFFAACDVLALTSDSECFALVQVEAMLCGTPVVMTNTPGGRVPVQKTGMGVLTEKGSVESIGKAIIEVLDHPEQYRKSRQEVEAVFSFQRTVDQYEAVFREYAVKRR
jgi:glycosyltransferase involved in cell wall biosynthesis